ncbi:hypothetical protein B0H14DRAFT_3492383 [Mycena olivaceomarginata]|nr:hypothetical protein B0H14DRAFT_3492383 [Mycena olivaceomarginata]
MYKEEIVEAVTIIETPPFVFVGVVGYVKTPRDEVKQRFYKNWYRSKKKAFTRYAKKHAEDNGGSVAHGLERIRKYCTAIRPRTHPDSQDRALPRVYIPTFKTRFI